MAANKNFAMDFLKRRPLPSRLGLWIGLFGLVILTAVATRLPFGMLRPVPPRTVAMAMYPEGSLNAELAKRYREVLSRNGVDLQLAPSSGAVEIQYLLLEAADEIHSEPGVFHTADQFPAAESIDLPLSPYAREFYKTGPPFLQRHLPFWLAVLVAEALVLFIPLIAIFYPLFRFAPTVYDWLEKRRVYRLYSELKCLEDELFFTAPSGIRKDFIERLDRLKGRASRLSVPVPFRPLVYSLRLHIDGPP